MNGCVDLETCIDLCLYLFPLFIFFVFAKKSSPNVNLQMKRDIELQKPVTHSSIWLGKRVSDLMLKVKFLSKRPKACSSKRNDVYPSHNERWMPQKIKKIRYYDWKWSQMKSSKLCYKGVWEVIYTYFYNWDWSHDLVLIVYARVELIIEASY